MQHPRQASTGHLQHEEHRLIKLLDQVGRYKHMFREQRAKARNTLNLVQAELNRRQS